MAEIIQIDFKNLAEQHFDSKEPSLYFIDVFNMGRLCQGSKFNPYAIKKYIGWGLKSGRINIQEAEYIADSLGVVL